jgi:hypothetical protein
MKANYMKNKNAKKGALKNDQENADGEIPARIFVNNNLKGESQGKADITIPNWAIDMNDYEAIFDIPMFAETALQTLRNMALEMPRVKQTEHQWYRAAAAVWSRLSSFEFENQVNAL